MDSPDRAIHQFRRQLATLLALKHALTFLTVWAFLWGTAVLALRAAVGTPRLPLLWGLAALPVALVPAFLIARRRLPSRTALRAVLDRSSGCGGLLMAGEEHPIGRWQESMPSLTAPAVRWRSGRPAALLAVGVAFVAMGFLVPDRFTAFGAGPRLEIGKDVEKLARQIDLLKEEAILDPTRAEALKQKLNQIKDEASGKDPVKTLEALDHVKDVTQKAAKEAAEAAARKNEQMGKAESLAEALHKSGDVMEEKKLAEAMAELAAMTKKAAEENSALLNRLDNDEALKKALKEGKLTPEQMQQLADALRDAKGDVQKMLEKLKDAGLIDLEALQMGENAGESNGEALAAFLAENGDATLEELLAMAGEPGNGGIDRGRGDAELTFGDASTDEGVKFKETMLPAAALNALKDSRVTGLSKGAPQLSGDGAPASAGALAGANPDGGSANTQVVLPRHRGAVERYFERPAKKK